MPKIFANNDFDTNDLGLFPEFKRVLTYSMEFYQSNIKTPSTLLLNFLICRVQAFLEMLKGKNALKRLIIVLLFKM